MIATELTGQVWTAVWSPTDTDIFLVLGLDPDFPADAALLNLESGELDSISAFVLVEGKYPHWKRIA